MSEAVITEPPIETPQRREVAVVPPSDPILRMIEMGIANKMTPAEMAGLFDLQERWEKREAARVYGEALAGFQADCPSIPKCKEVKDKLGNLLYKFADVADVLEVIQPHLGKWKIAVSFKTIKQDGGMLITCYTRVGAHIEEHPLFMAYPGIPNANTSQVTIGALSYGRRGSLCAALNLRVQGEDKDGQDLNDTLTDQQAMEVNDLLLCIKEAGLSFNHAKFLAAFSCESVATMHPSKFNDACRELKRLIEVRSKNGGGK